MSISSEEAGWKLDRTGSITVSRHSEGCSFALRPIFRNNKINSRNRLTSPAIIERIFRLRRSKAKLSWRGSSWIGFTLNPTCEIKFQTIKSQQSDCNSQKNHDLNRVRFSPQYVSHWVVELSVCSTEFQNGLIAANSRFSARTRLVAFPLRNT